MNSVMVIDDGSAGLQLSISAEVCCWRHSPYFADINAAHWVISIFPSAATREVLGRSIFLRPAVVDDFGDLVAVGELQ